uniref:MARVEL domain-containing protein n=1 Tax=Rhabditophanes sp. KR3021 TaxID=114890 RepID=A0AC35U7S8_9BILA
MDNFKAYGSSLTSGGFNVGLFIKKTTVALRITALLLSVVIWYLISNGAWYRLATGHLVCLYERSSTTCSFGSFMGSIAVVVSGVFLIIEAKYEQISAVQTRKRIVIADLICSIVVSVLFLITTFTLWSKYASLELEEEYNGRSAKFAVFFSFFSFLVWVALAIYAFRKYQEGVQATFDGTEFDGAQPTNEIVNNADYGYGGDSVGNGAVGAESFKPVPVNSYQQSAPGQTGYMPQQNAMGGGQQIHGNTYPGQAIGNAGGYMAQQYMPQDPQTYNGMHHQTNNPPPANYAADTNPYHSGY